MDLIQGLKQDISMKLQDELSKQLMNGENIVISLPGSMGEAFVCTDKRAFVIREASPDSPKCVAFVYPFTDIKSADISSSISGGYLELKTFSGVNEADNARVYFPSYDKNKFEAAADYIKNRPAESTKQMAEPSGNKCIKCGAINQEGYPFCSNCGNQLLSICSNCGGSVPYGAKYCRNCGMEMAESHTQCASCGGRVLRFMEFCPHCGALLMKRCASCNATIVEGWAFCTSCGREIGSSYIDARAGRLRERIDSSEGRKRDYDAAISGSSQATNAEGHNKHGQELFEGGNLDAAIDEFKAAVAMDQNNASYHCNLAIAYDENEQDDLALIEYEKTLELDPNDVNALLSLGYMYNEREDKEKAEAVWNRVLSVAPESAEAQEVKENLKYNKQL